MEQDQNSEPKNQAEEPYVHKSSETSAPYSPPTQTPREQQTDWQPAMHSNTPSAFSPAQQTTIHTEHNGRRSAAVDVVLQWLSYGLWEWSLITLSILLSTTLTYYFISSARGADYTWLAYVVASMLVLLPFAFVADRFYAKKEPQQKHGFAAVIMVINAVLVFLAAIGGLITCVVSLLMLFLSASASSGTYVAIVSSLVVAILSLLLFLRIMHFAKIQHFSQLFPLIIITIAGVTAVLALAGPFRAEVALKNDRLIENNLSTLNEAIKAYARKNDKLPNSLDEIDLSSSYKKDAKLLISKNLVTYKKLGTTSLPDTSNGGVSTRSLSINLLQKASYELCATFKKEKSSDYGYDDSSSSYIYASSHKAGLQCYQQTTTLGGNTYDY